MTITADARAEVAAFQEAHRMEPPDVAGKLAELLGGKLAAYVAGVTETRAVREWATGDRAMREDTLRRMREALTVALILATREETTTIQAWFQGINPQLEDRAPARLLRDGDLDEVAPEVRTAAKAFIIGG